MSRFAVFVLMAWLLSGCVIHDGRRPATDWSAMSKTIDVARDDIIRIITPFDRPSTVTTSAAEFQQRQHVLYLLATGNAPITMFVTNEDDVSQSINLTLNPASDGVREIDLIRMANATATQAASTVTGSTSVVGEVKSKRKSLRRDSDDHGDNDYDSKGW